jgi:Mrp family chromosome partitioning ATPase
MIEMETDQLGPTLCMEMNLGVRAGLREYLEDEADLEQILRPTAKENLWLLPAGPVTSQASRLNTTARTRDLFSILSETYDIVLVDLPPVLANEEAPALLTELDGIILIVTAGSTTSDEVERTLALCGSVPIRGVLLNQMHRRAPRWLASLVRPW